MAWRISFPFSAIRVLEKLPGDVQRRILARLEQCREHPRSRGAALKMGRTARALWRYRIGAYRVVCALQPDSRTVLVLRVAHRREVYR